MIAFIQARMSSARLPTKSLMMIKNKPLLYWVNRQVKQSSSINDTVIVTSTDESDDKIAIFCDKENISCYRGSLEDVHDRFLQACFANSASVFVRISGDSPFIDPFLIDHAVTLYQKIKVDIVTNTQPRSFPKGQSVEVISSNALVRLKKYNLTREEKEHVTLGIYNRGEQFKIKNFEHTPNHSNFQMSVDTFEDFEKTKYLFNSLGRKQMGWKKITELMVSQAQTD